MKSKEWRDLGLDEIEAKAGQLRSELFTARIRKETGQLENTAKLRTLRREIARAETILREMQVSRGAPKASKGQRKSRAASRRRAKASGQGADR
jgi:large subunit ribosomal protein L29